MDQEKPPEPPHFRLPDPALVTRTMSDVAERGQRIVSDFDAIVSTLGREGASMEAARVILQEIGA